MGLPHRPRRRGLALAPIHHTDATGRSGGVFSDPEGSAQVPAPAGGDGCYGAVVTFAVLLCTDGSAVSTDALAAGLELLGPDARVSVVTVSGAPDAAELTGSGFAGAALTPEEFDRQVDAAAESARSVITTTVETLGLDDPDTYIVGGEPGPAICQLASELSAKAIVIGSRGRGGLRRAVLGSVSDHVVRNAGCTVLVTGAVRADGPG